MLPIFTLALTGVYLAPPVSGWPVGTYGLIKAASGCPAGGITWYEGSRTFDTDDNLAQNRFLPSNVDNFLSGTFQVNDITLQFCMKITTRSHADHPTDWPKGSYCILKYGDCPAGFSPGSIYWDDEDSNNKDRQTGVLPDGIYDQDTKLFFCCRTDAQAEVPVSLPSFKPFVLLRYGKHCQDVMGMDITELRVRWDDEDGHNADSTSGYHPDDDGSPGNHQLHFCHYNPNGNSMLPGIEG